MLFSVVVFFNFSEGVCVRSSGSGRNSCMKVKMNMTFIEKISVGRNVFS